MKIAATTVPPVGDQSVTAPVAAASSTASVRGDSIALSDRQAIAARDGEASPSLFLLSNDERNELDDGREITPDHRWHDDALTGALLMRANASTDYIKRFVSPAHFQQAGVIDSRRDEAADAPMNTALNAGYHTATDTLAMGRNGVQSYIATGSINMHPTQQQQNDIRATLRLRLGEVESQSPDPQQRVIGAAYKNYDHEPAAVRGSLDVALDTATDPLTYATLGAESIVGVAGRVAAQAPRMIEAIGDGGSAVLNGLDDAASALQHPGLRVQTTGGAPISSADRSITDDVALLKKRTSAADAPHKTRGSFQVDEAAGGHTIKKHISKTIDSLRGRFKAEAQLNFSSAFTSEADAATAFSKFEKQYGDRIAAWKKTDKPISFTGDVDAGKSIGHVLQRGKDSAVETNFARFVIVPDSSPRGWHVNTSFPVRGAK